jgi:GT2 family glycosyltransferase
MVSGLAALIADVSVVICCYTEARWDDLCAAIDSVQEQSVQPKEIVVVVDHNPSLYDRLYTQVSGITVVENREARGLSGGRNTGVAVSTGAIVAFLDDDAAAEPHWLLRLVAPYADPKVLGVGGRIEPAWLTARPGWFPAEFNWVVGCSYRGLPTMTAPVRNLIGASMSFRRAVFEHVGGFRSELGYDGTRLLGNEETELSIRARQHWPDGVLLYEPRARVHHRVPASRTEWRYFRSRCYAEGLAKAQTSHLVGASDGLASEWVHTLHTLPLGVLRGVGDALWHRDPAGIGRAAAITAGLAVTTAGYLMGTLSQTWADRRGRQAGPAAVVGQPASRPALSLAPDAPLPPTSTPPPAPGQTPDVATEPVQFNSFGAPIGTPEPNLVRS